MALALLLTATAAGCKKDNTATRINIFAGNMEKSKVWMNPDSAANSSRWVPGEFINLNGIPFEIAGDNSGYYLDGVTPLDEDMFAIYPATIMQQGGDSIVISNYGSSNCAVAINSLSVNFKNSGGVSGHEVCFPMAAHADPNSNRLLFDHLTGGIRIKLLNNGGSKTVARLRIEARDAQDKPTIYRDLKPSWAGGLFPAVPGGAIGIEGNQSAQFVDGMTLYLKDNGNPNKTIGNGESIVFYVPMTAASVKTLSIKGYDNNGELLFNKTKVLDNALPILCNHLYNIPDIDFN